jgi:hypothetical protein
LVLFFILIVSFFLVLFSRATIHLLVFLLPAFLLFAQAVLPNESMQCRQIVENMDSPASV